MVEAKPTSDDGAFVFKVRGRDQDPQLVNARAFARAMEKLILERASEYGLSEIEVIPVRARRIF